MSNFLSNDLVGISLYIQEELEEDPSIINVGIIIYYDNKTKCVYYGTDLKIVLHHSLGQLLQF